MSVLIRFQSLRTWRSTVSHAQELALTVVLLILLNESRVLFDA